jgi:GAF domain-containing protein
MSLTTAEKKLEAIVKGARSILEKKTFIESAREIFDRCCEMTGAKSGYVALLSDDGEENEVLFLEAGGMPCSVDPELPMPIRGLRAISYKTHKAVYENDFMRSEWVCFLPAGHVRMHNVMFAPLNIEGKTVGIMGLANKKGNFTDDDADIASAFGELAAIALQNSRYLELLSEKTESLEKALSEIKTLKGIVPICMHCKGIRDDKGYWNQLEKYITEHTEAVLSHGICEKCLEKYYPNHNE